MMDGDFLFIFGTEACSLHRYEALGTRRTCVRVLTEF